MLTIKSGGKSLKTPVKQIPPLTPHRIVIILVGNKMLKTLQQIIFFIYLNMSNFVSRFQGAETKVLSKELCIEIQQLKLSAYNIDDGQGYQILGHIFQSSSEQVTLIAFEQHLGKPSKFFFYNSWDFVPISLPLTGSWDTKKIISILRFRQF